MQEMQERRGTVYIARMMVLVAVVTLLVPIATGPPADAQENEVCDLSSGLSLFEDVLDGDYGSDYIHCAKALGLTLGTSEGIFEPQKELTRAQMATFLVRLWRDIIGNDCPSTPHPFTDVVVGATHEANIACLSALGVTKGVTTRHYEPQGTLKVSQMTRFTVRMLNLLSPGTCDTSSAELTQAAACLSELNIAPSIAEAISTVAVSRAHMVVYLVGLWRNAAEGGRPPTPPTRWIWGANQENTMVAFGLSHLCWLSVTGTVTCAGQSADIAVAPEGTFTSVTAGHGFSCGTRPQGSIVCWGDDSDGQLQAPTGSFVTIASGAAHSCGIRVDGAIKCWGSRDEGQVDAPDGQFTTVTAGLAHTCALTGSTVRCWGDNQLGQVDVPSGRFTGVAAGQAHTCGVRVDGTVVCWGDNRFGQATAPRGRFTQVVGALAHSCGLDTRMEVRCWGDNRFGQTDPPAGHFTDMWAGHIQTCALHSEGQVICWG